MNMANDRTLLLDDLAGHWTEPVLEILKAAGIRPISVDMEVEAWRTVRKVLYSELRWQRAFRFSTLVSLSTLMEQVLREDTLLVAQKLAAPSVSHAFESRTRRLIGERRATSSERRLYAEIVDQPALRAAFKPASRTDFMPRLRVSAHGG